MSTKETEEAKEVLEAKEAKEKAAEKKKPIPSDNQVMAEGVIKNYMAWTGAAGIIPVPFADVAAISAIQLAMLHKIGHIYKQEFSSHWGKSAIACITAGYTTTVVGAGLGKAILRSIPIVGGITSALALPGFAAASTWAIGKIFVAHFESGGTLLNFDPISSQDSFKFWMKKHSESILD